MNEIFLCISEIFFAEPRTGQKHEKIVTTTKVSRPRKSSANLFKQCFTRGNKYEFAKTNVYKINFAFFLPATLLDV